MAILEIRTAPDPVLSRKALPLGAITPEVQRLLDDMLETMYHAHGIGLAAPQVGVSLRMLVMDISGRDARMMPFKMINPEIVWASDDDNLYNEGCLSVPDHYADVVRPRAVRVAYLDEKGIPRELDADGLLATCVQHEMDHLDGILFLDHISSLKRNMILRKLLKDKKKVKRVSR